MASQVTTPTAHDATSIDPRALPHALRSAAWFVGLCLVLAAAAAALTASMAQVVPFLLALGPAVIAVVLAWREGDGSLGRLVRLIWKRPTRRMWYAIVALPVVWALATVAVGIALGQGTADPFAGVLPSALIVPLVVLVPAFAEEIGWRGFAVPRLLTAMSPLQVALLLAGPWIVMHLVLMLPGGINEATTLWPTVLSLASYSIVLTWIFVGTGGSILVTALVHAGLNGVVPLMRGIDPGTSWEVRAVLAAVIAVAIIALGGFRDLRWTRDRARAA